MNFHLKWNSDSRNQYKIFFENLIVLECWIVLKYLILEYLIRDYKFCCRFHGYIEITQLSEFANYQNRITILVWELLKLVNYQVCKLYESANYPSLRITSVSELSKSVYYPSRRIIRVSELFNKLECLKNANSWTNCKLFCILTIQFETIWNFQSIYPFTVFAEWKPWGENCSCQVTTCSALVSFFLQLLVTSTCHSVRPSLLYCHLIKLTNFLHHWIHHVVWPHLHRVM